MIYVSIYRKFTNSYYAHLHWPSSRYQFRTEISFEKGKQIIEIDSSSFLGGNGNSNRDWCNDLIFLGWLHTLKFTSHFSRRLLELTKLPLWFVMIVAHGEREQTALENNIVTIGWNEMSDIRNVKDRWRASFVYQFVEILSSTLIYSNFN